MFTKSQNSLSLPQNFTMAILFEDIVFGPIKSRRFGKSLGINLLPKHKKVCTFNCIYCECGWTLHDDVRNEKLPAFSEIKEAIEVQFAKLTEAPDSITFAGNGEPTLHPDFDQIMDVIIENRDKHFPKANVVVLSNTSQAHNEKIYRALKKADLNVLKMDAGTEEQYQLINKPNTTITLSEIIEILKTFDREELIIQTLFLRGMHEGKKVDNTTGKELELWLNNLKTINPSQVMIYSLDRATPENKLEKVPQEELQAIAKKVEKLGITPLVY